MDRSSLSALRLRSGRSALKSIRKIDLTGKPIVPHSTGHARQPARAAPVDRSSLPPRVARGRAPLRRSSLKSIHWIDLRRLRRVASHLSRDRPSCHDPWGPGKS